MKKLLIALAVLVLLAGAGAGGAFLWWKNSLQTYAATPHGSGEEKVVEIPPGARMKDVARLLAQANVISDEVRFYWLARELKKDRQIKAGEYAFHGALLPEKVLDDVASGHVKLYRCTIPEGLWMEEIAALLEKCGYAPADQLLKLARDPAFVSGLGVKNKTLEGYLFPDTYSFPKNPKPEAVLGRMVKNFKEAFQQASSRRKNGVTLDEHETATLASIVEKETGVPEERPRISCVFHNRLKKNMKLETDPTVIYAKKIRLGTWDGNITRADLLEPHEYNTYTRKGLPPGPIASAGAAAIQAALNPLDCSDLFFVACGGGTHIFCPDYDCHLKKVEECQLGGKKRAQR
ncbi:MAG: endolytic transglycosylase MltG [Myxococcales bacterium]